MIEEHVRFKISWLIERDDGVSREVLMLGGPGDERALAVFSYEEEARLFLRLSGLESAWRVSWNRKADLIWVLTEMCLDTRRIALDPIPEIGLHSGHELVSLPREDFVEQLLGATL